jgi:hypothetical protein
MVRKVLKKYRLISFTPLVSGVQIDLGSGEKTNAAPISLTADRLAGAEATPAASRNARRQVSE